jgi:hypothetical protein
VLRFIRVLLVGLLCATTGGVIELVVPEPCTSDEAAALGGDGACAPTCLRCHCARPFDVVVPVQLASGLHQRIDWTELAQAVPSPNPHDVLHVPRPAAA